MNDQGLLLCLKYAFSPNLLGYCGPSKSSNLIDHLKEESADGEVADILSQFSTLYPYLRLIARSNKIDDPFEKRVVEAYWLGNSLLEQVSGLEYFYFLKEMLLLEKKLNQQNFLQIKKRVLSWSLIPHHSFHVFNIFRRTGKDPSFHTLKTMDSCRIGWGKIVVSPKDLKMERVLVETRPLTIKNKRLVLGEETIKEVRLGYREKEFIFSLKKGDWISFHWGYLSDILDKQQVINLSYYTQRSINFYNKSMKDENICIGKPFS